jgi:uncharacterized protein
MTLTRFSDIKIFVQNKLKALDPGLYYHNIEHTLDVLSCAEKIAKAENVTDSEQLFLIKIAALYHDTGFLRVYKGHEKVSCEIFLEDAGEFGFSKKQKDIVTSLIMATKVPQQPVGLLQQIICDADLDYLGRDDFYKVAENLRREFLHFKIVANDTEWDAMQLTFLGNHRYHTNYSAENREQVKRLHFEELTHADPD